jgi:hypothetical protein
MSNYTIRVKNLKQNRAKFLQYRKQNNRSEFKIKHMLNITLCSTNKRMNTLEKSLMHRTL